MPSEQPDTGRPPGADTLSASDSSLHLPGSVPQAPLIVVSGPSGVGKTTVVDRLLAGSKLRLRRAERGLPTLDATIAAVLAEST